MQLFSSLFQTCANKTDVFQTYSKAKRCIFQQKSTFFQ